MGRVPQCINTERTSCRGCEYSLNPALFDGGCGANGTLRKIKEAGELAYRQIAEASKEVDGALKEMAERGL